MKGLSNQRGQALILVALGGAFLFGLVALALDGGIAESDRRFLQSVGDGAALAGAQRLGPSPTVLQQQEARQVAVLYASSTLSGGNTNPSLPAGCTGLAFEFGASTHDPGTALCDPDSAHSLYVETPYCPPGGTCRNDQVLVRLSHVNRSNFAGLMGIGQISIASRSVAQVLVGGSSLGYALYVAEELQLNGSSQHSTGHLNVGGNLYVGGCITGTNNIDIHVYPTPNGQVGKVEVYYGDVAGLPATSFQPKQIWNAGIGQGARCQAQVFTGPNTSVNPNLPASFGAAGHLPNGSDNTCGNIDAPSHFAAPCPAGEPPNIAKPAIPPISAVDPWNCSSITRVPFPTTPQTVRPGCYDPCGAGTQTVVPTGDVFEAGTYSFFPSTTGCNISFAGDAHVTTAGGCATEGGVNPLPTGDQACGTDGASAGGVTFFLYNGTSWCFSGGTNCASSHTGTLTLNAPTNATYLNNTNGGMLIFDCPSGGFPCGSGGGQIVVDGPQANISLTGLIYAPTAQCTLHSNGNQQIVGQLVCQNASIQAGSSSTGELINFGGPVLPTTLFQTQLLE